MNESAIIIQCGDESMVGILHRPVQAPRNLGVLVVVGGPQYRVGSHRQFVLMARSFAAAGYAVLRFDYRGMGDSGGAARTFETVGDDIRAASDAFLAAQPGLRGIVIFGLCDAASAALMYCNSDPRVKGLLLANPWVRTEGGAARAVVRHHYGRRVLQRSFWSKVLKGEFAALASLRSFAAQLRSSREREAAEGPSGDAPDFLRRMLRGLAGFRGPVLLLLSDRDLTAREFQDLCRDSSAWSR
jgi:exosortase A-associated hydrolase 1